jgi:multiple sugar transport system substrate-binding protein
MTGIYQLWTFMQGNNVQPLDGYLKNAGADYDQADFIPGVFNAMKWDGKDGDPAGQGPQLGLPLATEVYCLAYNTRAFKEAGIANPPATMDELIADATKLQGWNKDKSGSYGLAIRGIKDWGTIHPAYLSEYTMYGAKDFTIENGKLVSAVNSPESIAFNTEYVKLVNAGGSPQWSSASWMQCQSDLGAGEAAMEMDATNNPIQVTLAGMAEKGNIAFAQLPTPKAGDTVKSNLWVWGIAMNKDSPNKEAAWKFMQYITSKQFLIKASTESTLLDPVRQSVWNDSAFKAKYSKIPGYIETFQKTAPNTSMLFTPQGNFMQTTTEWAAALQDMVAAGKGKSDADITAEVTARLNQLKADIDKMVQQQQ